jgi:putative peptidoglycan lipid II flippase
MFPAVLFTGIAYSFVGILQSLDEFNVPALISVVANLIVIAYYFTLNERFGIYGLACAFLIAWFVQAAIQAPSLFRKGFFFRPSLRGCSEGMKKVFALMLPVMVSTWVLPINLTINTKFGSRLFDGFGATAVNLSNNLYLIIIGVFIMSVTNVIFPRLSRLTVANEADRFRATLGSTVHTSMYFVIPMTAGLAVLARPVVDLIYGGGEFGGAAVDITSRALAFMSLGMAGYALQAVLSRAYFARQNGRTPLISGLASIAVNIALCLLLSDRLGIAGLAVASAAAATVSAALLIIPLEARGQGFFSRALAFDLLKMIIAALFMAGAVWFLMRALEGRHAGTLWKAVTAAVPAAVGVIAYAAATALLGLDEAVKAAGILKRRFGK